MNFHLWLPETNLHGHYADHYKDDRPFCINCHQAYFKEPNIWQRATTVKKSFFIPLVSSIQNFPVRDSIDPLYDQIFYGSDGSDGREEKISFWSNYGDQHKAEIGEYCKTNTIEFYISNERGDKFNVFAEKEVFFKAGKRPFKLPK